MRVMILGASGMQGHVITRWLRQNTDWAVRTHVRRSTQFDSIPSFDGDLYQGDILIDMMIDQFEPEVVINCVGILPARCRAAPPVAAYINTYLPHLLASRGKAHGFRVIHLSTDCVFSGKDGKAPYHECSIKSESGIYGVTKSAGEISDDHALTIRTSIIGPELKEDGTGLFHWFMKQEGAISGWTNAFWNGVTTLELAKFIQHSIESKYSGLCHFHAAESVSKFDLLHIFKVCYEKEIEIIPKSIENTIDKRLVSTRGDIDFEAKKIGQLVAEQKAWYKPQEGEVKQ